MKKLLLLFAAIMMASMGLQAETVKYIDADGQEKTVDATEVISKTQNIWGADGTTTWYVVQDDDVTVEDGVTCQGAVHLILADGGKLTVYTAEPMYEHGNQVPGIRVSGEGNSLTIYAQTAGTGTLTVVGGNGCAGIGGGINEDGGTITINGGTIVAQGGSGAAGIGGGRHLLSGGGGGTITIHGGVVTATGGVGTAMVGFEEMTYAGAGIGGGNAGIGGLVTIDGGMVTALGEVDDIGNGNNGHGCQVKISGGLFHHIPKDAWIAAGCEVVRNTDEATKGVYPFKVTGRALCTVTIGEHPHISAAWTSGEETESHPILGATFNVPPETESVKVIFTADDGYYIPANEAVVELGTVTTDITFGDGNNYRVPTPTNMPVAEVLAMIEQSMGDYASNEYLRSIIADEVNNIKNATDEATINSNKDAAIAKITAAVTAFQKVKADALGTMGTKQDGPAVILTDKDGKEFIFYSPKSVKYVKVKE